MKTWLFDRRIAGETYKFYLNECYSIIDGSREQYMTVETPENDFGYPDIIGFHANGVPYTLHRCIAPWKLRKVVCILEKNGLCKAENGRVLEWTL